MNFRVSNSTTRPSARLQHGPLRAIWLTTGYRPDDIAVAGLVLAAAASVVTFFVTDRKRSGDWIRFGIYSAGLSVSFSTAFVSAAISQASASAASCSGPCTS